MSRTIEITIENADKVRAALQRGSRNVINALGSAVREGAFIAEAESKKAITMGPTRAVKTGRLRASIAVQSMTKYEASIYPSANYSVYVHEGTRFMRPRPYMMAGARTAKDLIQIAFNNHIASALKHLM